MLCYTLIVKKFTILTPTFELETIAAPSKAYKYILTLPNNFTGPSKSFEGKVHRQKLVAKQSAAYYACIKLHELGKILLHLI